MGACEDQGCRGMTTVAERKADRMTMDDLVAFNNMAWRWVHGKKQPYLTDREFAYAIAVVVDGKSPKAVAEAMGVSSQTVSFVIRKLSFAQKRDWTSEDH